MADEKRPEHKAVEKPAEVVYSIEDLNALWDRIRVATWTAGTAVIQKVYKQLEPIAEEVDPKEKPTAKEK